MPQLKLPTSHEKISIPDGEIDYIPGFLPADKSQHYFKQLMSDIAWETRVMRIYGKEIPMPRLIAWYADSGIDYYYSGGNSPQHDWTPPLMEIKTKIEAITATRFNGVLLNLYRNGQDSMGWHSDDEAVLGDMPVIASLSLGSTRQFQLQHKTRKSLKYKIELEDGSLLIMKGKTQHYWRHQIPKETHITETRINLTFRNILTD